VAEFLPELIDNRFFSPPSNWLRRCSAISSSRRFSGQAWSNGCRWRDFRVAANPGAGDPSQDGTVPSCGDSPRCHRCGD
jgi:hypothetical protein